MDLTDKTWEDIFKILIESGNVGILIAVAIAGLALGWLITWFYFTRIRYYQLKNDLSAAREEIKTKQVALDAAQNKCKEYDHLRGRMNAENATKPDETDSALSEFYED